MAVATLSERGGIFSPFGDRPPSPPREQRIVQLRKSCQYFANAIDLTRSSTEPGYIHQSNCFYMIGRMEPTLGLSGNLIDGFFFPEERRAFRGSSIGDGIGFDLLPGGIYLASRFYELTSKNDKRMPDEIHRIVGRTSAFVERSNQHRDLLLMLLKGVVPGRMETPKAVRVRPKQEITVTIIGLVSPSEEIERELAQARERGTFADITYKQYSKDQTLQTER